MSTLSLALRRPFPWTGTARTPRPPHTPATLDPAARRRAIRVWILMATIVLLSTADLSMTLTYLRSVGMGEANPLARYVMSFNSPALLALWKFASVGVACLIFHIARHKRCGELACWACLAVLSALTLHWIDYSSQVQLLTAQLHVAQQGDPLGTWVQMAE